MFSRNGHGKCERAITQIIDMEGRQEIPRYSSYSLEKYPWIGIIFNNCEIYNTDLMLFCLDAARQRVSYDEAISDKVS